MRRRSVTFGTLALALPTGVAQPKMAMADAARPAPSDMLLATLWNQNSVEYRGNALTAYTLAHLRFDQAMVDKTWTGAPVEQKGDFGHLPLAVVLEIDETILDNSAYQVWMIKTNQTFSLKTWNQFCAAQISRDIPGSVAFTEYAASKGAKVFYLSNRGVETKADTRQNRKSSASSWAARWTPSWRRARSPTGAAKKAHAARPSPKITGSY